MKPVAFNPANYPKNWRAVSKAIRERAGHRCEWCGLRQYGIVEADWRTYAGGSIYYDDFQYTGSYREAKRACDHLNENECGDYRVVVLTVMHLNHDTWDNRPENLKAACQRCHLRHDGAHHAKNARATRERKSGQLALMMVDA